MSEAGEVADGPVTGSGKDKPEVSAVNRAGWAYLLLLTAITAGVLGLAFTSANNSASSIGTSTTSTTPVAGVETVVNLVFSGRSVNLVGEVPDEGALNQLVSLAEARYGEGNVTSSLQVNPEVSIVTGEVNVMGTAEEGDTGPNGLQSDVAAAFGLVAGSFDLTLTAAELVPVQAEAVVGSGIIQLSGAFPDRAAADQYVLAAEEIYGPPNVQAFDVTVNVKTTLSGALFGISGLADAGDTRATEFQDRVLAFFGGSNADTSGLQIDTSPEALARLEARLREEVGLEPILFASGSADLDPASDPILTRIAASIQATPGIAVEIVGHTDSQGGVDINQEISERRAEAVRLRLVELGVDEARLRARGAGESEPIADNETEEGRAVNRRIAFEFDGAG